MVKSILHRQDSVSVFDMDGETISVQSLLYSVGQEPANYPVPALRMNIRFEPDRVMIEDDWNVVDDFLYRVPFFINKD